MSALKCDLYMDTIWCVLLELRQTVQYVFYIIIIIIIEQLKPMKQFFITSIFITYEMKLFNAGEI